MMLIAQLSAMVRNPLDFLEPLLIPRYVTSMTVFYRLNHGECSKELF